MFEEVLKKQAFKFVAEKMKAENIKVYTMRLLENGEFEIEKHMEEIEIHPLGTINKLKSELNQIKLF
jgi:hypothetical protein